MKILVGTIITNTDEPARHWLSLQLEALRATTDFEHVAIIPRGSRLRGVPAHRQAKRFYSQYTTVLPELRSDEKSYHSASLATLQQHFLEREDDFDFFLFLDSDAFPIRKDWLKPLLFTMTGRHGGLRHDIATAYRPEFYETRLHASIVFASHQGLRTLKFVYKRRGAARGGGMEADVYLDPYTKDWKRAHRLIRSNRINIHPMLAGVYGDIFYHHGCGSRTNRNNRGDDLWWPFIDPSYYEKFLPDILRRELAAAPRKFLERFLWDPLTCALPDSIDIIDGPIAQKEYPARRARSDVSVVEK